jgi:hypothetical protein
MESSVVVVGHVDMLHNRSRTNFSRTTGHSTILVGSADSSSLTRRICALSNISSSAQSDEKARKA